MDFNKIKGWPGVKQLNRKFQHRKFLRVEGQNLYDGLFPDFATASANVPNTKPEGYNHPGPAKMYRDMIDRFESWDYPIMFWIEKAQQAGCQSILDFGGHFGLKYYRFKQMIDVDQLKSWTIYDVPEVVKSGQEFASSMDAPNLSFIDAMEGLAPDIFYASGSLQYLEGMVSDQINKLAEKPKELIIGEIPVHSVHRYFTIQSIGPCFCPYQIFQKDHFIADVEALGYRLKAEWKIPGKKLSLPGYPERSLTHYMGFAFTRI